MHCNIVMINYYIKESERDTTKYTYDYESCSNRYKKTGCNTSDYNKTGAILDLILGMVLLFLSIGLIFNPALLGFLTEISLYFAGIMLIIVGLASLINNRSSRYGFYIGIAGIILGVLYIIIGTYLADPIILGSLIGIWLVISGVLKLMDR